MKVQLLTDVTTKLCAPAIPKVFLTTATVFSITNDRVPDLGHVRAQLVGPTRHRRQGHPSRTRRQPRQHRIISVRTFCIIIKAHFIRVNANHPLTFAAGSVTSGLLQPVFDRRHTGVRNTSDNGPIDLAGFSVAKCGGKGLRRSAGTGQQQHTRSVFVQTVHQTWLLFETKFQRFRQHIHVAGLLAATL